MTVPFQNIRAQNLALQKELNAAVNAVVESSSFILGPAVEAFEKEFAKHCGVRHAIGVNSGTAGLAMLLQAYGIGEDDEVIVPVNTFIATAEAVSSVDALPVFADCEKETGLIDIDNMKKCLTNRTKAIIAVHLYGQPADMDEIMAIAKEKNIIVIEDACQAHAALYKGKKAGSIGHAAAFSFYPAKNLGAWGDAGGITTNDDETAMKARQLRDHGSLKKYVHERIGSTERMDGIHGAILEIKLKKLDEWTKRRREIAARYVEKLQNIGDIGLMTEKAERSSCYHLFVITTEKRDELQKFLTDRGIETLIHYPIPLHLQQAYAQLGYKKGDFPNAEFLAPRILSLPIYPEMNDSDVEEVCTAIGAFFDS